MPNYYFKFNQCTSFLHFAALLLKYSTLPDFMHLVFNFISLQLRLGVETKSFELKVSKTTNIKDSQLVRGITYVCDTMHEIARRNWGLLRLFVLNGQSIVVLSQGHRRKNCHAKMPTFVHIFCSVHDMNTAPWLLTFFLLLKYLTSVNVVARQNVTK